LIPENSLTTGTMEQNRVTTLINVYTVRPNDQRRLVDLLIWAKKKVTSQQEGFISARIHKSLDGSRVVNYMQWKSKQAIEKMLKNPRAIAYMNDALSIANLDGSLYQVVFVNTSMK
jgi:quinol monooxygenase YgiN